MRGALGGPLIPQKTAARDTDDTFFKINGRGYMAVKILKCLAKNKRTEVNCEIKNNVFIITDTGGKLVRSFC
ncbi:MAG: hypothetical protein NZ866_00755 [Patescibacteria group bacterium]|nr:hypothetical protein [Patescibacteria group bacterium]